MNERKFAVFILTHGRPDKVITLNALAKSNYAGDWYLLIDNEDKTAKRYVEKYGKDRVVMFDKLAISKTFDTADLSEERRAIVYARNACFHIAKELGYDYFVQFDDDYTQFTYRFAEGNVLRYAQIKNINKVFDLMLDFLDDSQALTVCFSQGGDHMGGVKGKWQEGLIRKTMNSFFCRTDRPFQFVGRVNEDVNTYTTLGSRGQLMLTVTDVMLNQIQTQANGGGMTDLYLKSGTYIKSFFTVMMMPSAVEIREMGVRHKRLHHHVKWEACVPKIVREHVKKKD